MAEYNTKQRRALLEFLKENSEKALTVEEIASGTRGEVSKSTAYRLMTKFVEDGLVHRSVKGNSRNFLYRYINDGSCEGHIHMKCVGCGKVYHLGGEAARMIQDDINKSAKFVIDSKTVLLGKCEDCKK